MPLIAKWQGETGTVIQDNIGRVLVDFGTARRWLLKGIPDLVLYEHVGRGRPRKHGGNAEKQRAYRQRKAGKALRKYHRHDEDV